MAGFGNNNISIHAPRAGGDPMPSKEGFYYTISIHAPRAGGDKER